MQPLPDGLYPVYLKDGRIYPVGLTAEQYEIWKISTRLLPGKIHVFFDKPMGEAVNLVEANKNGGAGKS
jgi:hypothetical protein